MKIIIGEEGLNKSWGKPFPKVITCEHCKGSQDFNARIVFVAYEGNPEKIKDSNDERDDYSDLVCELYKDMHAEWIAAASEKHCAQTLEWKSESLYSQIWPQDCCAFAVYICHECFRPSVMYNVGKRKAARFYAVSLDEPFPTLELIDKIDKQKDQK